ncbi:MAG: histidinol-phosphate transaminase [Candidatus Margulisiibacteriota bacterium]
MFNKKIDSITPYTPGQSIESIKQQFGLKNIIKLASNENPLGPAYDFKRCNTIVEHYPDYNAHPLIGELAKKFNVNTNQIILGNGSDELLQIVGLACIEPGDEILSSERTFSEYEFVAHITGAKFIKAPIKNYTYSVENLISAITTKTKIIFIANPNNPTGTYINETDVIKLLKATPKTTLVVIDEAYAEYVDAPDYPNTLNLIKQYPNLMITRTFSKIYGLANLRVGYGIAQDRVVNQLQKVRQPFNVNGIALACAYQSLKNDAFVQKSIQLNNEGKNYLIKNLRELKCTIPPSQGNFLYIDFESVNGVQLCKELIKHGVIVRSMKSFGQNNAIRVTIGTLKQNETFIKELHECLKKL